MRKTSVLDRYKRKTELVSDGKKTYTTGTEAMSTSDKEKFLKELGLEELGGLFEGWQPRTSSRKKAVPLDQRISISVTPVERAILDKEISRLREMNIGTSFSMGAHIRSKAVGSIDIELWREKALAGLKEIEETIKNRSQLEKKKASLFSELDSLEDEELASLRRRQIDEIDSKLDRLKACSVNRRFRLSGRMTVAEIESVKWRAQRLCLTVSDYLRMMIFDLVPNSESDAHLTLDGKRRFYISILDVAKNGWGSPPEIYECKQCAIYMDRIRDLRKEINRLHY